MKINRRRQTDEHYNKINKVFQYIINLRITVELDKEKETIK